ncbi:MAG TPA: methylated-DNA--[protein]-cysteine S-methyltransferase [Terriglobales bacterium]|nr:methylated-DNA--[protein]-cysteine S-methyltransferase [Terriglobales bacterium]
MSEAAFDRAVYALVRRIPKGRLVTYGQVAALLGRARAARAVGGAMRRCPPGVPWHRVVNAQGRISRRARAASMLTQRMLLEREGVKLRRGRVDLAEHAWDEAAAARPGHRRRPAPRAGRRVLMIDDQRAWR